MPLQATSGAASYDAFGGGAAAVPNYIEEVFGTFLYTGNGSTQTITNGIDLSGKGGLVWTKQRSGSAYAHNWIDTVRGRNKVIFSNSTIAEQTSPGAGDDLTSFNANGFSIGANYFCAINLNNETYASWTFRKQPKFFDVVTYTGTQNYGGSGQTVSHSLGSTPGCIIIKPLSDTSGSGFTLNDWIVYHRGLSSPTTQYLKLNTTASIDGNSDKVKAVSSTTFTAGWEVGLNGIQYVAYVFAHNAGGFGLTGTDNVISCGSYTGNGSATGPTVTLGYEPQWVLIKRTDSASGGAWALFDNMRGLTVAGSADPVLYPNSSDAEFTGVDILQPLATGFQLTGTNWNISGGTYIYIAIRRGPMKVPTVGSQVYNGIAYTKTNTTPRDITGAGFPPDLAHYKGRSGGANSGIDNNAFFDRLRGTQKLVSNNSNAEQAGNQEGTMLQDGIVTSAAGEMNYETGTAILHFFRRAPSFFDEVCYTGNGASNNAQTHNLGVAPELLIIKNRSANGSGDWYTFHTFTSSNFKKQLLDTTDAQTNYTYGSFLDAQPTSTTFTVNSGAGCNASGTTYVAYLFATCAGVSKVGSYTGNGSTQTINCGFTGGARFVLIKCTSTTGDWYVYDTARGMTTLTDPYLLLNSTAAESATLGSVTTVSTGFALNAGILAAINTNGASYIFLAIA